VDQRGQSVRAGLRKDQGYQCQSNRTCVHELISDTAMRA
jgi:hypothetical protein